MPRARSRQHPGAGLPGHARARRLLRGISRPMKRWIALILVVSAAAGCGGSLKEQRREGGANFGAAKALVDRGNYLDAIPGFKAYIEQYPRTERTEDPPLYLGGR